MTNYYVKFDENGIQSGTRFGLDQENPSGWIDTGLDNIDNIQFKLVNGSAVPASENEILNMRKELSYLSGLKKARVFRNVLLSDCDWTQGEDSPLSESDKALWVTYRQQLRDLPSTVNTENGEFTLPTPPDPNFNPLQ
jgi:hypothetical protein